jgi:anaerobic magnesium-protoporphyrin IX monomethyl ester cyclase
MKILILNPPFGEDFCRSARWVAKSRGRVQRHPDWLLTAAAVLEKAGHEVKFVDAAALNLKESDVSAVLREFKPVLTVLHTSTPSIYNDIDFARIAKHETGCKTALVGPHVSVNVGDTFEIAKGAVDYITRGEYDYILRDIASGMRPEDITGLSYLKDAKVRANPGRPALDVNELPFPAWHLIKPEWYRDAGKRFPFLTLISGRGCFGKCTFCRDTPTMYGHKLRFRDPKLVVDEIESDFKLFPQLKEIMFETDTFTAIPAHVRGVCEEIFKRKLNITWSCNARVDMDLSLLPLMKKAGCRMLMIGFEFGTQAALDAVKKGITLGQSRAFAKEADRLGFILHGCFMIGAPGETKESAQATIDFANSLPLDTIQVSGVCVYPGTEMYTWAKQNGYLIPTDWREWISEDREQVTLLNYPQLSKNDIDGYVDKCLRAFYLRPVQILKMVFSVRSLGDIKRKLFGLGSFFDYFFSGRKDT